MSALSHETLKLLQSVLDDTWLSLRPEEQERTSKTQIGVRILELAAAGERDPVRLRNEAMKGGNQKRLEVAMARTSQDPDEVDYPTCANCAAAMQLLQSKEEYPGYSRQTFGCQTCGHSMTQWRSTLRQKRKMQ